MTNKTHVIDGVTYREVERKAEVGDKVVIVGNSALHQFNIGEVARVIAAAEGEVGVAVTNDRAGDWWANHEDYLVLEPVEAAKQPDMVENPPHYNAGRFEVIDVIEDAVKGADGFEGACVANIIKYTMRYRHKNGLEDVKKAAWYLARLERYLSERDGA